MIGFQKYFWFSRKPRSWASSDQSPARSATQPETPDIFSRRFSTFSRACLAWCSRFATGGVFCRCAVAMSSPPFLLRYPWCQRATRHPPRTPRGYIGGCALEWAQGRLPDGVGGVVGARRRLPAVGDRAGVGSAGAYRVGAQRQRLAARRGGDGAGRRVVVVLLRGDR